MSLDTVLLKLNKKFGAGTVVRASDALGLEIQRFSTGSFALDISLSGGFVEGRINEIAGHYSSYKSTLAIYSCNAYLKKDLKNRYIVWVDVENSFDVNWLKFLDADPKKFLLVSPTDGEEAVDLMYEVLKEGDNALVVLDSVAALVGSSETENSMSKNTIGAQPRFISKMLRKIVPLLKKDLLSKNPKSTIIALNQVRVNIGQLFGDPEAPTGGKALEHAVSICVKLKRRGFIYEELAKSGEKVKQSVGSQIAYVVLKNKTGGNIQDKGIFSFYNRAHGFRAGGTVDNASDLLPLGVVYGQIKRSGNSWAYGGINAVGREKFCELLYNDKKALRQLHGEVIGEHLRRVRMKYNGADQRSGEQDLKTKKVSKKKPDTEVAYSF